MVNIYGTIYNAGNFNMAGRFTIWPSGRLQLISGQTDLQYFSTLTVLAGRAQDDPAVQLVQSAKFVVSGSIVSQQQITGGNSTDITVSQSLPF